MIDLQVARVRLRRDPRLLVQARTATDRAASYPESGVSTGFHPASHHGEREERIIDYAKINKYHVSMVPYLLEKLKNDAGWRMATCSTTAW